MEFDSTLLTELSKYMQGFVTHERLQNFDRVLEQRSRHLTVVLDDIYHEQNSSAVVRTAECMGLQDIHIIEASHGHKLSRYIAKGADKWLSTHFYNAADNDNTASCLSQLKAQGYRLIAASPHIDEMRPEKPDMHQKSALIIGSEKTGLSNTAKRMADVFVKIPIYGFTESYNLSNAAALILYTLNQKMRTTPGIIWQLSQEEKEHLKLLWVLKSVRHAEMHVMQYLKAHNISLEYDILKSLGLKNLKRKKFLV